MLSRLSKNARLVLRASKTIAINPASSIFYQQVQAIPAFTMARNFSKFYQNSNKSGDLKSYTLEQIEEAKLGLEGGINALPEKMRAKLQAAGVNDLFPVQTSSFSLFAHHENELIVKSRTGTGKTLSFLLPLEFLLKYNKDGSPATKSKGIRAVILEPTRELATQV